MKIVKKYRKYRLKKLETKMDKLRNQFRWFYDNKRFMDIRDYERVTDIIAGEMIGVRKKISKLKEEK